MPQPPHTSATSIPNLLSLSGARGGLRGRGRGSGPGGHAASSQSQHDTTIQGTDTDAAMSRRSAVDLGYLDDPYARYFVPDQQSTRRLPIINRGTYTRTIALDRLVDAFVNGDDQYSQVGKSGKRQIVSLGAGTDTRCFRLFSEPSITGLHRGSLLYHEVDFPSITLRKRITVLANTVLRQILCESQPVSGDKDYPTSWRAHPPGDGDGYWCHGLDLRDLKRRQQQSDDEKRQHLVENDKDLLGGLRFDVPTLLISECCLCYLDTTEAQAVIQFFTDRIQNLGVVLYEPIKPNDAFGRQMVANLAARRITMPTLELYKEARDQEERLRSAGFTSVGGRTVDEIWEQWVSGEEKERLDILEGLDEVEEWQLLASHYIVAWGWKGAGFDRWCGLP